MQPAPITAPLPIFTSFNITLFEPIQTSLPITIFPALCPLFEIRLPLSFMLWFAALITTFDAMRTLFPITIVPPFEELILTL